MSSITPGDVNILFNAIIDLKRGSFEQNTFIVCSVRKPEFDLAHAKEIMWKARPLRRKVFRSGRGAICLYFV